MENNKPQGGEKNGFGGKAWEVIKKGFDRYFIKALSGMALGLFCSLIIGLILEQFSKIPGLEILNQLADVAKNGFVVGAAIGASVANGMGVKPLVLFSSAVVGSIAYTVSGGGPVGCFVAAVVGSEAGNFVCGKTRVDIVLVPLVTITVGGLLCLVINPGIQAFMTALQNFIGAATELTPIPMGIAVSVLVGLALTAPISSAAICAGLFIAADGGSLSLGLQLAAGAATAGCCAQMVGFAVISWRENKWGGLLAQGLGTSMLQVPNIMRHPQILIPPVVASAITGPICTTVLQMKNAGAAAGMGTSGLVGLFGTWGAMYPAEDAFTVILKMVIILIIAPAAISILVNELLRKIGWIKTGYMTLPQ